MTPSTYLHARLFRCPMSAGRPRCRAARRVTGTGVAVVATLLAAPAVHAQSADNVLVLVNAASDVSRQVAEYYARQRGIARERLLELRVTTEETISRGEYVEQIELPVARWLASHRLQDRVLYIVVTKGMPLRVSGREGRGGTIASVDSELTLLYRKSVGLPVPTTGPVENPYFLRDRPMAEARPFSRADYDIYLVTRLDGYTLEDVIRLIDRAQLPSRDGRIVLDMQAAPSGRAGDGWLQQAAGALEEAGFGDRVVLDQTPTAIRDLAGVLGYYSWGSNDAAITARDLGIRFVPGAIAASYVSTDGRTFNEPPAGWRTGTWDDRTTWFGGSPQSLAADAVRAGVTGLAAHVSEPFLDATIRPQILFPAYLHGLNLAEAFYLSMPFLSWQSVVIGDPLCAPFRQPPSAPPPTDARIDPVTELPAVFTERRVAALSRPGIDPSIVRRFLKAEARLSAGDAVGARAALEEATGVASHFTAAQLMLASIYEGAEEYDKATARYRQVVEHEPNNVLALNNLAFALAVRRGQPAEALPLAESAQRLSPMEPGVLDTLGWIHHLLGRPDRALPLLAQAAELGAGSGEIQLHAAAAFAAAGRHQEARSYLARAIEITPSLANSQQVVAVERQLR